MKKKKITKLFKTTCDVFLCKKNLARDVFIISITIVLATFFLFFSFKYQANPIQTAPPESTIFPTEKVSDAGKTEKEIEIPAVDISGWQQYVSQWYGFELKYPQQWSRPVMKKKLAADKWEYRFQFRKKEIVSEDLFSGFDVIVYNVISTKELADTEEFPAFKNEEAKTRPECVDFDGRILENTAYPAEEVYVKQDDACYQEAYFFNLIRDRYIYDIVPIFQQVEKGRAARKQEIAESFPEFVSIAASFSLVDIIRPKPIPPKPKITAPLPVSFKIVNGRRVCEKGSKDKPSKSKKGKGKHLDMECCLDPDEYPNPNCYYPPENYGKFLK
jgi:hypothetical protein